MFRPIERDDRDTIVSMAKNYYHEDGNAYGVNRVEQAIDIILSWETLGKCWLIEKEKIVVGYICLTLGFSLEAGGRDFFLDELYIKPEHRNKGLGTKALNFACDQSKKLGAVRLVLEVEKTNPRARALYERVGFEIHPRFLMSKFI